MYAFIVVNNKTMVFGAQDVKGENVHIFRRDQAEEEEINSEFWKLVSDNL